MAMKKEWNKPAIDDNYKIDCMTIAPMNEIPKVKSVKWTKTTGKDKEGLENVVSSEELTEGIVLTVEDGGLEQDKALENN